MKNQKSAILGQLFPLSTSLFLFCFSCSVYSVIFLDLTGYNILTHPGISMLMSISFICCILTVVLADFCINYQFLNKKINNLKSSNAFCDRLGDSNETIKPERQQTLSLKFAQCLLRGLDDLLDQQQMSAVAHNHCSWRKLVVACSTAER